MKTKRYLIRQLSAAEVGQTETNETYVRCPNDFDYVEFFQEEGVTQGTVLEIKFSATDLTIGNTYNSKVDFRFAYYINSKGKEKRIPGLTEIFRKRGVKTKDYIKLESVTENGNTSFYVTFIKEGDINISPATIYYTETETSSTLFTAEKYNKEISLLTEKHNLILTGAPGTGKTYAAKEIAASIISNGQRCWEQLTIDEKNRIGFTQFHPSYDYTDFVEGLRPNEKGNFVRMDGTFKAFCKRACDIEVIFNECYKKVSEELELGSLKLETDSKSVICRDGKLLVRSKDGRPAGEEKKSISIDKLLALYKHCISNSINESNFISKEQATLILMDCGLEAYSADSYLLLVLKELLLRSRNRISRNEVADKYIFIIDEINRGELSKILGELFYSIEPDYRGEVGRVTTQYANMIEASDVFAQGFFIPKNVYILGTMNDVDRGVEAMDFAIRRRFAWHEVTADESAKRMGIKGEAKAKMDAINEIIKNDLGRAYCIGGSYFRAYDKIGQEQTWENHLHGIIYEYYRGEPKVDEKVQIIRDAFFAAKEAIAEECADNHINSQESNN